MEDNFKNFEAELKSFPEDALDSLIMRIAAEKIITKTDIQNIKDFDSVTIFKKLLKANGIIISELSIVDDKDYLGSYSNKRIKQ